MTKSNIFKMELYRNFRDKAYLIVIGSLTALFAIASGIGVYLLNTQRDVSTPSSLVFFEIPFVLALFFGFLAFSIIYPWHLLSTDYNNKVLSLVIASGVKRSNFYFIKILATILSNIIAYLVIGVIPVILLLGFFSSEFINFIQSIITSFTSSDAWLFLFNAVLSGIASIVLLYFVVIITRGKFWGVFVYLGISFAVGIITSTFSLSISAASGGMTSGIMGQQSWIGLTLSVVEIIAFGLAGYFNLIRQDL